MSCSRCLVSATNVWADQLRLQEGQAIGRTVKPVVAPGQGVRTLIDHEFLPTDPALLIPKTADGRGLIAMLWLGACLTWETLHANRPLGLIFPLDDLNPTSELSLLESAHLNNSTDKGLPKRYRAVVGQIKWLLFN